MIAQENPAAEKARTLLIRLREEEMWYDPVSGRSMKLLAPIIDGLTRGIEQESEDIHLRISGHQCLVTDSLVYDRLFDHQTGVLQAFDRLVRDYSGDRYKVVHISFDECVVSRTGEGLFKEAS